MFLWWWLSFLVVVIDVVDVVADVPVVGGGDAVVVAVDVADAVFLSSS